MPQYIKCQTCNINGLTTNVCRCADVSESAELACSVAISFSEESRMLARSVLRKWWKEKKISANINQVDDEEYLAFVIEHKRLP